MINDILTEGYFNTISKRDSVSIEDTKSRVQTVTANKFVQDLCNDIRGDNFIICCSDERDIDYINPLSKFIPYDSDYSISDLTDPIQFLFCQVCRMLCNKGLDTRIRKIEIYHKSDPDNVLFKIDDPYILDNFYDMRSYMYDSYQAIISNIYWTEYPYTSISGRTIRTAVAHSCCDTNSLINWDAIIEYAIKDCMRRHTESDGKSSQLSQGKLPDNYDDFCYCIKYITDEYTHDKIIDHAEELYIAFQNALDKEFTKHQGKPSLINILKSVVLSDSKLTGMMKDNFAKLSDYISSQLPVRIDIVPVLTLSNGRQRNIVFDVVKHILEKFPDMFSEGSGSSLTRDSEEYRIVL